MAAPEAEVTLESAVRNVQVTIETCRLDGPVSTGVVYTPLWMTNCIDHKAYECDEYPHLSRETAYMTQMEDALQVGEDFMWMLYAYRSCARAIPQLQQTSQSLDGPNKDELYLLTYQLLKEEVTKMKRLKKFCDQISALVCRVIEGVALDQRENFASPEFLFTLGKVMNLFVVMDALKNMKASLNNDFSMYKR
ncbi:MAG: hypothetical protein BJ554DRAFT_2576 [Olpidium bornovanus]|uniref:CYRIA/CYRIB Rac1 binding domain-containing protein n=1 Tax=Olpidium bornovanus TaxID=278681 RepID=A0A8H8DGU8_9FUNG|nr:MAG: hypothetical protein BJ554DRAFT_2576 [Olpidium bornovanus]